MADTPKLSFRDRSRVKTALLALRLPTKVDVSYYRGAVATVDRAADDHVFVTVRFADGQSYLSRPVTAGINERRARTWAVGFNNWTAQIPAPAAA